MDLHTEMDPVLEYKSHEKKYEQLERVAEEMEQALKLTFEDCPVEYNCPECDTTRAALTSYAKWKEAK